MWNNILWSGENEVAEKQTAHHPKNFISTLKHGGSITQIIELLLFRARVTRNKIMDISKKPTCRSLLLWRWSIPPSNSITIHSTHPSQQGTASEEEEYRRCGTIQSELRFKSKWNPMEWSNQSSDLNPSEKGFWLECYCKVKVWTSLLIWTFWMHFPFEIRPVSSMRQHWPLQAAAAHSNSVILLNSPDWLLCRLCARY